MKTREPYIYIFLTIPSHVNDENESAVKVIELAVQHVF